MSNQTTVNPAQAYRALPQTSERDNLLKQATERLVSQMASVDADMIRPMIEEEHGEGCAAMPMWSTVFRVLDPVDARKIRDMLEPMGPPEGDAEGILAWIEDQGLDVDTMAYDDEEDGIDEDGLYQAAVEAWSESGSEDYWLSMCGWEQVGSTGLLAIELQGDLYLGVDGAGYSFYGAHWIPLYLALGYSWHESNHHADLVQRAVRELASQDSQDNDAMLDHAHQVARAHRLSPSEAWLERFGECPPFNGHLSGV